ncbi:MAG: ATPase, partial [Lachnospiraceae bacterium]|nr:ATPase [Lachnospiraceae bacterium]
ISPISYWTNPIGKAEVDFLIQSDQGVIPIEVKSGTNLNAKSLRIYRDKYSPKLSVRFSMQNLRLDGGLLNIPLYLIGEFPRLMKLAMERVGG